MKELTQSFVSANAAPVIMGIGIYFLLDDGEVVYVGKTTNVYGRIVQHLVDKKFDRYYFHPCKPYEVDELEVKYILAYEPKYNNNLPHNIRYFHYVSIRRLLNTTAPPLKRFIALRGIKPVFGNYYDIKEFEDYDKSLNG